MSTRTNLLLLFLYFNHTGKIKTYIPLGKDDYTWHSFAYVLWNKPYLTEREYFVSFTEYNGTQEFWKAKKNLQIYRRAPYKSDTHGSSELKSLGWRV